MIERSKTAIRALLPKNIFAREVSMLVGGTASAQILLVLAAPILTRLYTPEDFGLLAAYASLLALIGVISSLRYELAIPLPEDDVEAANVAVLSLLLVAISTVLTGILVLMLGIPIAELLGVPVLANYLWLLPVGVLLSGAYSVFNYWSVRTKRFSTIAQTKLTQAIATLAIQLTTFKFGGIGLLLGQVAGQSIGMTSLARPALAMQASKQVSWVGIRNALVRYQRFPIFSTWEGFLNTASLQVAPLMIASYFTPYAAGLFSLTHRVISLPVSLVGGGVSQVFFSSAAESRRQENIKSLVLNLHSNLAHISLPPLLVLGLYGPTMFDLVFGDEWRGSGELARWVSIWIYCQIISSPMSPVFSVYELQKEGMVWQACLLLLRLAAIYFGVLADSLTATVTYISISSAAYYLLILLRIASITGNRTIDFVVPTSQSLVVGLLCAAPLLFILVLECDSQIFGIIGFGLSCILVIARLLYLLKKVY